LIAGLAEWAAQGTDVLPVVLGGGCLMNRVLAEGLARTLRSSGHNVFLPRAAPANDGGIALGQAAFARHVIEYSGIGGD
jgi:hydrogenase maturation protein HypF